LLLGSSPSLVITILPFKVNLASLSLLTQINDTPSGAGKTKAPSNNAATLSVKPELAKFPDVLGKLIVVTDLAEIALLLESTPGAGSTEKLEAT
jgi:hypothetical protein